MGPEARIVIDPQTRESITVDLPLRFPRAVDESRESLGFPSWVDLTDPFVARAVSLADAAARRPGLRFPLVYFGGVANRLVCPSSNDSKTGLRRELHDTDLVCRSRDLKDVMTFLKTVGSRQDGGLLSFETPGDKIFNALSEGRRFRLHHLVAGADGKVQVVTQDLLADQLRFCHTLDVKSDLERSLSGLPTLSPTTLLLAKLQFIRRIPADRSEPVRERVLESYGRREFVIGPEERDTKDVVALLLDHSFDQSVQGLSLAEFDERLSQSWGLWRTVGLNLAHLPASPVVRALPQEMRATVAERLQELSERLSGIEPSRRLGFLRGQWWQDVDEAGDASAGIRFGN